MKVIFLDIDGVLNTDSFIMHFWEFCASMELARPDAAKLRKEILRDEYGSLFDPIAVDGLKWIIVSTEAKIVISSSWRKSGLSIMQEMWEFRQLPPPVIDVTPYLNRVGDRSIERGVEIKEWLDAHPEVESYVIFDDDSDMLPEQLPYFIQTDPTYGITLLDAEKAIAILNKQEYTHINSIPV